MHNVALASAYLVCTVHAWRLKASTQQLQNSPLAEIYSPLQVADGVPTMESLAKVNQSHRHAIVNDSPNPLKILATLIASLHPSMAFNSSALGLRFPVRNPSLNSLHVSPVNKLNGPSQQAHLSGEAALKEEPAELTSSIVEPRDSALHDRARTIDVGQPSIDDIILLGWLGRESEAKPSTKEDGFTYLCEYITVHILLMIGALCFLPASFRRPHPSPNALRPAAFQRTLQPCMSSDATVGHAEPSTSAATPDARGFRRYVPPLKWLVLGLLVVNQSIAALLVRHTRQPRLDGGLMYLGSAAVLCSELIKLPVCLLLIARDEGGFRGMAREVRGIFVRWRDTLRMSVPAIAYGLQNALYYVALSHLSATSYQLWSQSKTLFTALFFVKLLGRVLTGPQWFALGLLTIGVGFVQIGEMAAATRAATSAGVGAVSSTAYIGIAAVLTSCILSAFANVYFEKVIKGQAEFDDSGDVDSARRKPKTIWLRNVQLGLFSIPQAVTLLLLSKHSREVIAAHGVFAGFTPYVWMVTMLTAGAGLIVASVVKHADNVLKTYASASAILLTCVVTALQTGIMPSPQFLQGMSLVLFSMGLYNGVGPLGWWKRTKDAAANQVVADATEAPPGKEEHRN